ncbi:MAG: hypothetical protein STHCBS139747_006033 [Sporothrix thermara]
MEVAYRPANYSYSSQYGGSSIFRHRSPRDLDYDQDYDTDRVLHYSYGTSPTEVYSPRSGNTSRYHEMPSTHEYRYSDSVGPSSATRYHGGSSVRTPTLRRSATSTSTASYDMPSSSTRYASREPYKGMGSTGMLGMAGMAAVGAVAGAAITYSVMRSGSRSRSQSSRDLEYDDAAGAVPSFQRRSTFPESYQDYAPATSRYGSGEGMRGRSQKESRQIEPVYDYDYDYDGRGRAVSSRHVSGGSAHGSRSRAHSEAGYDRAPPMISEGSYHLSRHEAPALPSHALSSSRRGSSFEYRAEPADRIDRDSYASGARSHRTVRGSGSGGGSRLASIPPNSSRSAPLRQGMSRSSSYNSARNVPLPPSGSGSIYSRWEEDERFADDDRFMYDDDNDSVVPSDSISCVGARNHSSRHR